MKLASHRWISEINRCVRAVFINRHNILLNKTSSVYEGLTLRAYLYIHYPETMTTPHNDSLLDTGKCSGGVDEQNTGDKFKGHIESSTECTGREKADDRVNGNITTKRLSRNTCEKIRRDRMKTHIHQLASKLPMTASCGKKLDKCSILRLTVAFLKMHTGLKKMKLEIEGWCPSFLSRDNLGCQLHQTMDGFFLVVSQSGTVVYVSDKITTLLGHSQFNLLGKSFYELLHQEDQKLFRAQFQSASNLADKNGQHTYCSMYLRMLNLKVIDCLKSVYSVIHLVGNIQRFSLLERSRRPDNLNEKWLIAVGRLQVPRSIREISLVDYHKSEWISQHEMNGAMFYIDSRVSFVTGFLPSEQEGLTPYSFLHEDDLEAVATSHMKIMKEDLVPETIFRLKTADGKFLYVKSSSCVARDNWTKQAKFIVSLNQLLDEQEGAKKLEIQRQELASKKSSKMFTDDILTIMSDALTGTVTPLQDEVQCENMDWGCSQFMTPMGNVIRSSVSQQVQQAQHTDSRSSTSTNCTSATPNSVSATTSRKRPAEDPFVKLIQASIMSDEEMDVSPSKCLQLSETCRKSTSDCSPCSESCAVSSEDNLTLTSGCKACCSSNKQSGSMLKSLLTDEHGKHSPCLGMSSRVLSPDTCSLSPRTPGSKQSADQPLTLSSRVEKENSQADEVYDQSVTPMSVKSSSSDQSVTSPGSPVSLQSSFVVNFTEQLKQKHALMEQSLLLQEVTIFTLESEVNKVKSTGHSSPYLQKICERLHAIKTSKAKQQAELQCLQNKLNQQKNSSTSSSSQSKPRTNLQMSADVPSSTLAQIVFPDSESAQSMSQIDLGEIEPTFYPTVMSTESSKSGSNYNFSKNSVGQPSSQGFSHAPPNPHSMSNSKTHSSQAPMSSHKTLCQSPYPSYSQSPLNSGSFSPVANSQSGRSHISLHNSINQSVSGLHDRFSNHSNQQQFQAFPTPPMAYHQPGFPPSVQPGHSGMVLGTNQTSGSSQDSSTQPYYTHQMPLTTPTVNSMAHSTISARIIDGDRVKSRNERIKIIASAYSKLPQPVCHTQSCSTVPSVQSQNTLYTM